MTWTTGSLFSGIGGLELGLERAGIGPVLWQVERDPFRRQVLARHWPHAERFADVRAVGAAELAPVAVVCGGFPCQDNSRAGARAGLAGKRSGLWGEFARIVSELAPEWVVAENVAGGAPWVDDVVRDLEKRGYASLPVPLSAADVGAPHIRPRVFVVARHTDGDRKPMGAEYAQVAELPRAATPLPGWSEPPCIPVADGISPGVAALGDAVVPRCAEVVGWMIRELSS